MRDGRGHYSQRRPLGGLGRARCTPLARDATRGYPTGCQYVDGSTLPLPPPSPLQIGFTFCRPCLAFEPKYERLAKQYGDAARFVKVNGNENGNTIELCRDE